MSNNDDGYRTHSEEYLERQQNKVKEELRPEHAERILDFLYDRRENLAPSTARNYARELRYLVAHGYENESLPDDPEEWYSEDWEDAIRRVARKRDLSDGTKRNTCYAARAFVDWSSRSPADKSEISAPKIEHSKIDEEWVLKPEEVTELIETTHTDRDAALIAVMYEAALRRTAAVQLDIRDYRTDRFARIRLPHKTGVKTGQGRERPLSWSRGYLDRWLNNHPTPDDPEAPLFCSIRAGRDEGKRLSSHAVYTMIKRTASRSDIDSDRIHPHALRHARATEMRKMDWLDKRDIETVMGWTDDTPMHGRYTHTTATEDAEVTAKRMGVQVDSAEEVTMEECSRCGAVLPPGGRYCANCTLLVTEEPPEWWEYYSRIAEENDPVIQQYNRRKGSAPPYARLPKSEFEHVKKTFMRATLLMDSEQRLDTDLSDSEVEDIFSTFLVGDEAMAKNYLENVSEYRLTENFEEYTLEELEELAEEYGLLPKHNL
jgi:integrase